MSCGAKNNYLCTASSCGDVRDIQYPFRLKGDLKGCGRFEYELARENNCIVLYLYAGQYYVKSIYYDNNSKGYFSGNIMVVDDGLQKSNCSSLPRYSLASSNFSDRDPYSQYASSSVVVMKCSQPVASPSNIYTEPCIEGEYPSNTPPTISQMKVYSYAMSGFSLQVGDIKDSCSITMMTFFSDADPTWEMDGYNRVSPTYRVSSSYKDLHNRMAEGFALHYSRRSWPEVDRYKRICAISFRYRMAWCNPYDSFHFLAAKFILGAPCVLILLILKWMRRHQAADANIEEFLLAHNNFLPIRYSYSDIKRITKNFKCKLGEGGYGFVYRGILRSGNEVAVKILNKSKSNGQDFISKVATIGRIHHINVVQLVGFCFDYSKQALVYDFMPNGSLDKHISYKDGDDPLNSKKMYEISLGIARGIEYLHRGCDMQILHFDIKPHNILLDRSFTPKVSDFGLARLYPTDRNIVSLTAARGTLGYMAPELFYKDIGGISYKADVHSFGMLLMEMAGRRRNLNAHAEHSSQIYFPLWVYDQLGKEKELERVDVIEEERETTRKMIIVALWCIQLSPNDRPSMRKVLDMLEGDMDRLQLPPKPLLYRMEAPVDDADAEIELETVSSLSSTPIVSSGYQF
ncbi:rust resistance kinase Lr10-like [Eucalyptus grandis]|uniref:rust resistance kinase Lr10-like n=1 Tax=Eucalyptus grandis TaxID=71139 RepID=UPI00192EF22A|nr:rust resistance kinase Lr10-like [Eucalyptus grandis]